MERSTSEVRLARAVIGGLGRLSPELAARLALWLFRRVRKHRVPERELRWVESAVPFRIEGGAEPLRGLCWGEGPSVLLQHGWEGRASQMGGVATALAEAGFRAVSLEAPGHGGDGRGISALWEFAAALDSLVEREGPFEGFVGHSFGVNAACFSLLRGSIPPRRLGSRLVFLSPAADLDYFFEILFALLRLRPEVAEYFVLGMERGLGVSWERASRCAMLAAHDVPLLVVHDEEDRDTPIAGGEAVAAAWPRSRMLRTRGLGHRRVLRDPRVLDEIAEFLRQR